MNSTDAPPRAPRRRIATRVAPLLAGALAAACGHGAAQGAGAVAAPNVLVVCIDALRADRLGAYGASPSPSPSIDAFAKQAVVFENATSVASWTKPAVPSLLTGLYPDEHGVYDNSGQHVDTLAADATPLAAILAQHGYRTAAFVENDQLVRRFSGLDRGFSLYLDGAGSPPEIVHRFLSWSAEKPAQPWFAYLHFLDPHFPYTPDEFGMPDAEAGRLKARVRHWDFRGLHWWMMRERVNAGQMKLDDAALADLDRLYRLEIRAVDAALGRLLRLLEADGVLDRTMVVVTADHGEGFLEHGRIDHGYGPYEELLHVPLIVRRPGGENAGSRRTALAQNVDIAATVLDTLGIARPAAWSSVSLVPALADPAREVRGTALALEHHGQWQLVGLRDARYSYIRSEGATRNVAVTARPPSTLAPGTRIRVQGIFDGARFIGGVVRHLAPGDPDTELQGPVEDIDRPGSSFRVFGVKVPVTAGLRSEDPGGGHDIVTMDALRPGEIVRVHGSSVNGVFHATKIETEPLGPVEVEGVVRTVEASAGHDLAVDLGDVGIAIDPRVRWRDFPDGSPHEAAAQAAGSEPLPAVELLFDRRSDPRELHDIAAAQPAQLERMRMLANEAREGLHRPDPASERRAVLDEDARERLRALGYVE